MLEAAVSRSVRVWCTGLLVVGAAHGPAQLLLSNSFWPQLANFAHTTKLLMTKKHHHASVTNSCFLHIARSGLPTRAAPIVAAGRVNPRSHVSWPARGRIRKKASLPQSLSPM